ncbi:GNAT family N-acetyltransferase [Mucilaginibacter glaciei]|uniref:GNAT family N-acetyltransferase n=1 Tax=Mucilaginibacter glaciei TaxID=2772109 RepID=A0A926NTM7_9SPHI|nr:GNAT family N-acetyltransferase [Mucilaginibacter glaciei]MBD1394505.1 GNAT family N-acetyltransferase [Mucilaginibacter glaciei]
MKNIKIRPAEIKDLDTLRQFEQGVVTAERSFDPTIRPDNVTYYDIEDLIVDPHIQLLVAELDGEVIGSGYARIENSKPELRHRQHAYLGFMYVLQQYRGKGVNGLILSALKNWAAANGISELRLEVYNANESAITAYEKFGFGSHMLVMRMGL